MVNTNYKMQSSTLTSSQLSQTRALSLWFIELLELPKQVRQITLEYLNEEEISVLASYEEIETDHLKKFPFLKDKYTYPRIIPYEIIFRVDSLKKMISCFKFFVKDNSARVQSYATRNDLSLRSLVSIEELAGKIRERMKLIIKNSTDNKIDSGTIANFEDQILKSLVHLKPDIPLITMIIESQQIRSTLKHSKVHSIIVQTSINGEIYKCKFSNYSNIPYQENYITQFIDKFLQSNQQVEDLPYARNATEFQAIPRPSLKSYFEICEENQLKQVIQLSLQSSNTLEEESKLEKENVKNSKLSEFILAILKNQPLDPAFIAQIQIKEFNEHDNEGNTALIHAVKVGNPIIINQLINAKADVNFPSMDGKTPLMHAAIQFLPLSPLVIDVLLKAGADKHATNKVGKTALQMAQECKNEKAIQLLKDKKELEQVSEVKEYMHEEPTNVDITSADEEDFGTSDEAGDWGDSQGDWEDDLSADHIH